jgi:uncharacterized membrane protein YhdT
MELLEDSSNYLVAGCVGVYLSLVSAQLLDESHWYCLGALQVPLCFLYIFHKRTFSVVRWEAFVKSTCFTQDLDLLKLHDPDTYYSQMLKLLRTRLKCPMTVTSSAEGLDVQVRSWQPSDLTLYLWVMCNPVHLLVAHLSKAVPSDSVAVLRSATHPDLRETELSAGSG